MREFKSKSKVIIEGIIANRWCRMTGEKERERENARKDSRSRLSRAKRALLMQTTRLSIRSESKDERSDFIQIGNFRRSR